MKGVRSSAPGLRARHTTNGLLRIEAPHFVAGIEVRNNVCARCAPIIRWARGMNVAKIYDYCRTKGWTWLMIK